MGLSDVVRGWISSEDSSGAPSAESPAEESSETVIYECRDCGTTVTSETTECPNCESTAIAEYPVE